jgi:glycosyltransferase involved in cell wall biosynthesis
MAGSASMRPPGSRGTSAEIVFLGLLPPPIDGQRIITRMMLDQIAAVAPVAAYNLQPRTRRIAGLAKLWRTLGSILFISAKRWSGSRTLYLAPPSGHGMLFACAIALTARLLGFRIFVHYHSWKVVAVFSWATAVFLWGCGPRALHITLAPPMAAALRRSYRWAKQTVSLSNSAFFDDPAVPRRFDRRLLRLGHLSNLSESKGIECVMRCAEAFEARGLDVELILAGPMDAFARPIVEDGLAHLPRLRYRGALTPGEVSGFYSQIDVFLFPTKHPHEAEPLVVLDALAAGVPVIATDRGCIPYLLDGASGSVAVPAEAFVARAIDRVSFWAGDRPALAQASLSARNRVETLRKAAKAELPELLRIMCMPSDDELRAVDRAPGGGALRS